MNFEFEKLKQLGILKYFREIEAELKERRNDKYEILYELNNRLIRVLFLNVSNSSLKSYRPYKLYEYCSQFYFIIFKFKKAQISSSSS